MSRSNQMLAILLPPQLEMDEKFFFFFVVNEEKMEERRFALSTTSFRACFITSALQLQYTLDPCANKSAALCETSGAGR
jgi:hypothetical protein